MATTPNSIHSPRLNELYTAYQIDGTGNREKNALRHTLRRSTPCPLTPKGTFYGFAKSRLGVRLSQQ